MNKRVIFIFIFLAIGGISLFAQNRDKEIPFRMSIRASASIPHSISNKAFRRSFTGIYDVAVNWDYQIFKGFVIGLQYRTNEWKTADNKIPGINTYAQAHNAGLRVGYDIARSATSTAYVGLTAEQGMVKYFGLSILPNTDISALQKIQHYHAVTLDAGVFFYTEGNFAIGISGAGVFTNYHFSPYSILLNQHKAYIASDLNGNWAHINLGFNVVYSFWKTKGATTN